MRRSRTLISVVLIAALALIAVAGCSGKKPADDAFTPSYGILDTGFWKDVKALEHVKLCDYVGIPIPNDVYAVSDGSIQTEIDAILAQYATEEQITDRAAVDGDTVNIDYVGRIGGVAFDGGSTEGQGTDVTIGLTSYIDDFLEQIIGHKPGESFDVEVTFPKDYGKENLNGKDAVFAVKLNYIVKTTVPDLNDAFVSENLSSTNGWKTVSDMRTGLENNLRDTAVGTHLREYIVENTTVTTLDESLLEYQRRSLIDYYQGYADSYSMGLEEFLTSYVGVTSVDGLLKMYADETVAAAKLHLILQAIAEDVGISVTDKDVSAYFKEQVGKEDYSEYKASFGMPYLKLVVLNQKVMDYLRDKAIIET